MTRYPALEEIVVVHAKLIAKFGGLQGIRDLGALQSALGRPQCGCCLSQNHPFIDGNKRAAITITAAFLGINGYRLGFDDAEAFSFLNELYETGRMRFEELELWLREHVVAITMP